MKTCCSGKIQWHQSFWRSDLECQHEPGGGGGRVMHNDWMKPEMAMEQGRNICYFPLFFSQRCSQSSSTHSSFLYALLYAQGSLLQPFWSAAFLGDGVSLKRLVGGAPQLPRESTWLPLEWWPGRKCSASTHMNTEQQTVRHFLSPPG